MEQGALCGEAKVLGKGAGGMRSLPATLDGRKAEKWEVQKSMAPLASLREFSGDLKVLRITKYQIHRRIQDDLIARASITHGILRPGANWGSDTAWSVILTSVR